MTAEDTGVLFCVGPASVAECVHVKGCLAPTALIPGPCHVYGGVERAKPGQRTGHVYYQGNMSVLGKIYCVCVCVPASLY